MSSLMTVVSDTVPEDGADEVLSLYDELLAQALPEGLLRTELLQAGEQWQFCSVWRDRMALDAMRAGSEPPAAPLLFRKVGATPEVRLFEIRSASKG